MIQPMRNSQPADDSLTKISRSKSRNQISAAAKLRQKQYGWNGRFHLEHIPEYNYMNEPHSQYLKNKFRMPNKRPQDPSRAKRPFEHSLDKNKVSNKPNPRKNQQRLREAISKAYADLETLWISKNIPSCHMETKARMFSRENNPMKVFEEIKQEFAEIDSDTSVIQKLVSSIGVRESCVEKLIETIKVIEAQVSKGGSIKDHTKVFEEKVSHLRILTIHCVECIYQWRQSLEMLIPQSRPVFLYKGQSYNEKIAQDYKEICSSVFSQIYTFDTKLDAFFLNYNLQGKKITNVSKNLVKRIRVCQIVLNEEQQVKDESEVKRTPMIHKIKTPVINRQEKSLPPRGKATPVPGWKKILVDYGQFQDYFQNLLARGAFNASYQSNVDMQKFQEITVLQFNETGDEIALGVDKNSSQRKVIVLGVRSIVDNVQNTLKAFCEYLWEVDSCSEIRMPLVHIQDGEHFAEDAELCRRIKLVGFRWVSVNHNNDLRLTIYSIKRPLNAAQQPPVRRRQAYPAIIEHLSILRLTDNPEKPEKVTKTRCLASPLSILDLLKQQSRPQYEQISQMPEFASYLQSSAKIKGFIEREAMKQCLPQGSYETTFEYSGLKAFEIDKPETLDKIFRGVEIPKTSITDIPCFLSLLNASFRFKHSSINDARFTKFFPSKDNQILICESNYPIYLLQSDEENINFFIIEVEETFSLEGIDSIFNGMGEQSSFIDEFWLPNFSKTQQYEDEAGLRCTELVSTDYTTSLGSLTRKSKVRTKIIKAPFVFGMINKRLLEMLQVPFFYTLVRKEDVCRD